MYEIEHPADDPLVEALWRAVSEEAGEYLDPAHETWGIAFTRAPDGTTEVALAGPAPSPRTMTAVVGERYWGVELHAHVVVAGVRKADLLGLLVPLRMEEGRFLLGGSSHAVPDHAGLRAFVRGLADAGVLEVDEEARRAIGGDRTGWSERSWQRRIRAATGLTAVRIAQLERVRAAAGALQAGLPPGVVAADLGFADQAHLTRSMVALRGERPGDLKPRGG